VFARCVPICGFAIGRPRRVAPSRAVSMGPVSNPLAQGGSARAVESVRSRLHIGGYSGDPSRGERDIPVIGVRRAFGGVAFEGVEQLVVDRGSSSHVDDPYTLPDPA
jgi:hypothetical protein